MAPCACCALVGVDWQTRKFQLKLNWLDLEDFLCRLTLDRIGPHKWQEFCMVLGTRRCRFFNERTVEKC